MLCVVSRGFVHAGHDANGDQGDDYFDDFREMWTCEALATEGAVNGDTGVITKEAFNTIHGSSGSILREYSSDDD